MTFVHYLAWLDAPGHETQLACDAIEVTVRHGRADPDSQPDAGTATIDFYEPLPAGLDIGAQLRVKTSGLDGTGAYFRYIGYVTDISLEFDLAVTPTTGVVEVRPFTRVMTADSLGTMGRRFVGDTPWPQELDGPRVSRIIDLAALPFGTSKQVDPGTVALMARDVDRQSALELVQSIADQAGGLFFCNTRDWPVYHDAEHRRAAQPILTLDACQLVMSPSWERDLSGLVNEVAIGYGPTPDGGEQPVTTASNPTSQARFGRVAFSASTELATLPDATVRANALLTRNAFPVWNIDAVSLVLTELDPAAMVTLMRDVEIGSLLGLTGLPIGVPDTTTALWVEGWEERLAAGVHELTLYVSGYCRTAPFVRWDDVNPDWTWDNGPGNLTWDESYCLGPIVSRGRWADVPATITWNNLYTSAGNSYPTWDTWPF